MQSTLLIGAPHGLLCTCPNHLNGFSVIFSLIGATLILKEVFCTPEIFPCSEIMITMNK